MDLNFHYYAVKTLAIRAGFTEEQGQVIANYSQFVDDFTSFVPIILDDVPDFAQHLATKWGNKWLFTPVTTGFESWFDMARLILEVNQRAITVPFHFIPPHAKLNEKKEGDERTEWRVVAAHMNVDSQIRDLMLEAQRAFIDNPDDKVNLIRIGLLLHIFADTYAHQNFSGFWGWENYCSLEHVYDNSTKEDITDSYSPKWYFLFPGIGHTEANHAPDDSNVTIDMKMKLTQSGGYDFPYSRSNTSEFCALAREVIDYFSACLKKEPISGDEWIELCPLLGKGFLTSLKQTVALDKHWKSIFPDIEYCYDKESVMDSLLEKRYNAANLPDEYKDLISELAENGAEVEPAVYKAKSDEYFRYNVLAENVRTFVNGTTIESEQAEKLRKALNALGK